MPCEFPNECCWQRPPLPDCRRLPVRLLKHQACRNRLAIAKIDEGEAIKIYPQTGGVHKSNTKVSAQKHLAALGKGAREISKNTVIYKQGGKMYMYDYQDEANTEAAENFQSQFDNDY